MADKINKSELVSIIKEFGDYKTTTESEKALLVVTKAIVEVMGRKQSVTIPLFGTFKTVEVAEKSGKVPGTDKTYTKAAHTAPKMTFAKSVKDHVASAKK